MKRSIAIAALSLSSALSVHAQSSVTIYGLLEQSVGKYTGLSSINPTLNLNLLGSPGIWTLKSSTSSRLGFRGTEDLGGGTKAFFLIEHRLAPDTGATQFGQTGFFGGQSFVGLGGTWGDVRLGHMFVPGHVIATLGDPYGLDYNIAGGYGFVKGGSIVSYGGNAIDYRTPNLGGLVVEAQVALGEEISVLRRYLEIQRARFPDRMSFTIDASAESERGLVPTLLLQPLAEMVVKCAMVPSHLRIIASSGERALARTLAS